MVEEPNLTRRRALQLLAALGITGPLALEVVAQARRPVTVETLRASAELLDQGFSEDRLRVIQAALQRNLDQFQIVRDLEIDDLVEPAPIFDPEAH